MTEFYDVADVESAPGWVDVPVGERGLWDQAPADLAAQRDVAVDTVTVALQRAAHFEEVYRRWAQEHRAFSTADLRAVHDHALTHYQALHAPTAPAAPPSGTPATTWAPVADARTPIEAAEAASATMAGEARDAAVTPVPGLDAGEVMRLLDRQSHVQGELGRVHYLLAQALDTWATSDSLSRLGHTATTLAGVTLVDPSAESNSARDSVALSEAVPAGEVIPFSSRQMTTSTPTPTFGHVAAAGSSGGVIAGPVQPDTSTVPWARSGVEAQAFTVAETGWPPTEIGAVSAHAGGGALSTDLPNSGGPNLAVRPAAGTTSEADRASDPIPLAGATTSVAAVRVGPAGPGVGAARFDLGEGWNGWRARVWERVEPEVRGALERLPSWVLDDPQALRAQVDRLIQAGRPSLESILASVLHVDVRPTHAADNLSEHVLPHSPDGTVGLLSAGAVGRLRSEKIQRALTHTRADQPVTQAAVNLALGDRTLGLHLAGQSLEEEWQGASAPSGWAPDGVRKGPAEDGTRRPDPHRHPEEQVPPVSLGHPTEPERSPLGRAVLNFGSDQDGSQGLFHVAPLSQNTVDWLQSLLVEEVEQDRGMDPDFRKAVRQTLTVRALSGEWAKLLSSSGLPVRAASRGREYQVSLRIRLGDPKRDSADIEEMPDGPPIAVQRWAFGNSDSGSFDTAGDIRRGNFGYAHTWQIGSSDPVKRVTLGSQIGLTLNETKATMSVGRSTTGLAIVRSRERTWPVTYGISAELRRTNGLLDALKAPEYPSAWKPVLTPAPDRLTVWFPSHLIKEPLEPSAPDASDPNLVPAPLSVLLHEVPLFAVETVPRADELLHDVLNAFEPELRHIADGSLDELRNFFSEGGLRGNISLMLGGRHSSPLLRRRDGSVLGQLAVRANLFEVARPRASAGPPTQNSVLEAHVLRSVRMSGSTVVTNSASVGFSLGAGMAIGAPDILTRVEPWGGTITAQTSVQARAAHRLNSGGSASTSHSLRTARPLLRTHVRATYDVVLVRPDGKPRAPLAGTRLARQRSDATGQRTDHDVDYPLILRAPSTATVSGAPTVRRFLPAEIRDLQSLGVVTTPLAVRGAQKLFDHAEEWLRDRGFLPENNDGSRSWYRGPVQEARLAHLLANVRALDLARSDMGLRSAIDEMIDGSHVVEFKIPSITGTQRVSMRISLTRDYQEQGAADTDRGVVHEAHLRSVQTLNFAAAANPGSEEFYRSPVSVSAGAQSALTNILNGDRDPQGLAGDYGYTWQQSSTEAASAGSGQEMYALSPTSNGVQVFTVPVVFRLEMSSTHGAVPTGEESRGSVRLAVPTDWTLAEPAPAAAPPGIRRVHEASSTEARPHASASLDAPEPRQGTGSPEGTAVSPEAVQLPETAFVNRVRGGAELRDAVIRLVSAGIAQERETTAGTSEGTRRQEMPGAWADDEPALPADDQAAPVQGAAALLSTVADLAMKATGLTYDHTESLGALNSALSPHHLVAHAHRIFRGSHVAEFTATSGLLVGTDIVVEIQGYLTNVTKLPAPETMDYERWLQSVDTSVQSRTSGTNHAFGVTLSGNYYGLNANGWIPSGRYAHSVNTTSTSSVADSSNIFRVTTENDVDAQRFEADATYQVTVRTGLRNVMVGAIAPHLEALSSRFIGENSLKVEVPRAVEFILSDNDLINHPEFQVDGVRAPKDIPPADRHLPAPFIHSGGQIGFGTCVEVHQKHGHPSFGRKITELVEKIAPGITIPGHAAYNSGIAARINEHSSPVGMRAVVGAGPEGRLAFHFVHRSWLGPRLVEILLRARPNTDLAQARGRMALKTSGIDTLLGRSKGEGSVLPGVGVTRTERTRSVTDEVSAVPTYQRDGHRFRFPLAASRQAQTSEAATYTAEQRAWQRSMLDTSEFALSYRYDVTVRAALMGDAPIVQLPRMFIRAAGWLADRTPLRSVVIRSLPGMVGTGWTQLAHYLPRFTQTETASIDATAVLRFNGSETSGRPVDSRRETDGRLYTFDPTSLSAPRPGEIAIVPDIPSEWLEDLRGRPWLPTRPFTLHQFDAVPQLVTAVRDVGAVDSRAPDSLSSSSTEAILNRLATAATTGQATEFSPAALSSFLGQTAHRSVILRVSLFGARAEYISNDVAIDRVDISAGGASSQADVLINPTLSFGYSGPLSPAQADRLGPTVPVLGAQASAGRTSAMAWPTRELLRYGTAVAGAKQGTRGAQVWSLAVVHVGGPSGSRWVVGQMVLRTTELPPGAQHSPLLGSSPRQSPDARLEQAAQSRPPGLAIGLPQPVATAEKPGLEELTEEQLGSDLRSLLEAPSILNSRVEPDTVADLVADPRAVGLLEQGALVLVKDLGLSPLDRARLVLRSPQLEPQLFVLLRAVTDRTRARLAESAHT
ncbi:hypothetical protein ACWGJX_38140 [Streptomyces sp. NPDC054775]